VRQAFGYLFCNHGESETIRTEMLETFFDYAKVKLGVSKTAKESKKRLYLSDKMRSAKHPVRRVTTLHGDSGRGGE
jgi:hypothetical protein